MMLATQDVSGSFGHSQAFNAKNFLSLQEIQQLRKSPSCTRKLAKPPKLRIVPPLASANRPRSNSGTTRHKKASLRPKQESVSPVMSGYSYSSSDQGNYNYTAAYQQPVPQYTQSQVNQYYAQYQCYPPQPYQIIPDYYQQPVQVASTAYEQHGVAGSAYDHSQWQAQPDAYDVSLTTSQGPTRSSSRTRTWTCEIAGCTSSANFTRLADLQRHQSTVHGVGTPEFPCTVPRCNRVADKGFTRRDHLVEHLRNFHHIDIPKRRPGERSAFPFGWPEGFQNQDEGDERGESSGVHGVVRGSFNRSDRTRHRLGSRGGITKSSQRGGRTSQRGRRSVPRIAGTRTGLRSQQQQQHHHHHHDEHDIRQQQHDDQQQQQQKKEIGDTVQSNDFPLHHHQLPPFPPLLGDFHPQPTSRTHMQGDLDPWQNSL